MPALRLTRSSLACFLALSACADPGESADAADSSGTGGTTAAVADGSSTGLGSMDESTGGAGSTSGSTGEADESSGGETAGGETTGGEADPLPGLDPGPHLGMIVGFEEPAPGTEAEVQGHWDDAVAAGMDIGRVQVDWADLEPAPGEYALEDLVEAMEALQEDDLQIMVTLSTIDSLEYTMPDDLGDPDDPLALADGMAFDDPIVTERFAALLDEVVPVVAAHGGFLISVGNEPDNHFEENPAFAAEVAGFTAAAREHAATVDPAVAISMTLTYGSVDTYDVSDQVVDAMDVVTFNLYCQGEDGDVLQADSVAARVSAMLDTADGKPVVVQELGCPAGWDDMPTTIAASPENQATFFEAFAEQMQVQPQLRAAFIFQMLDWSPALTQLFAEELEAGGFDQATIDLFTESLGTIGLCHWTDATCRPAWDVVLEAMTAFRAR